MGYDNVKLWFAKNENDEIVTIDDLRNSNTYLCPVCGSDLIPKATTSKRITPHFAHIDKTKCSNESMIHFWFKHKFLEPGDTFKVITDKEHVYVCKDVLVEQRYAVDDKIYRPDVTVITECGKTIYFEMKYSNKKEVKDYIDIWLELKNIVAEIDIKQLMNKTTLPSFKALFYDGKCFNTKRNDTYYNTIGKYKEELSAIGLNTRLKERIKQLDWFWNDIQKFENKQLSSDDVSELIYCIDKKDIKIIKQILKKINCSYSWCTYLIWKNGQLMDEINNYFNISGCHNLYTYESKTKMKASKINEITVNFINKLDTKFNFDISVEEASLETFLNTLNGFVKNDIDSVIASVQMSQEKVNYITSLLDELKMTKYYEAQVNLVKRLNYIKAEVTLTYIGKFKIGEIKKNISYNKSNEFVHELITSKKTRLLEKVRQIKFWYLANNNRYLNYGISVFNSKYREIDGNYYLKLSREKVDSNFHAVFTLFYDYISLGTITITNDILFSKDVDIIIAYIEKNAHYLMKGANSILKEEFIINHLESNIAYLKKTFPNLELKVLTKNNLIKSIFLTVRYKNVFGKINILENLNSNSLITNEEVEKLIVNKLITLSKNSCSSCNSIVELSTGELKFYLSKQLNLPKRCKCCRKTRKQSKGEIK